MLRFGHVGGSGTLCTKNCKSVFAAWFVRDYICVSKLHCKNAGVQESFCRHLHLRKVESVSKLDFYEDQSTV